MQCFSLIFAKKNQSSFSITFKWLIIVLDGLVVTLMRRNLRSIRLWSWFRRGWSYSCWFWGGSWSDCWWCFWRSSGWCLRRWFTCSRRCWSNRSWAWRHNLLWGGFWSGCSLRCCRWRFSRSNCCLRWFSRWFFSYFWWCRVRSLRNWSSLLFDNV